MFFRLRDEGVPPMSSANKVALCTGTETALLARWYSTISAFLT